MAIDPLVKARWLREFRLNGFVILRRFLPILRGVKERGSNRTGKAVPA